MKGPGGDLLYKCRLCGAVKSECHVPNASIGLLAGMGVIQTPKEWFGVVTATSVHFCTDNRMGISDLVGCQPDGGAE